MREESRDSEQERTTIGKKTSKGGLRDGTDVRRVARQTGKEREVDTCPFRSASF